MDTTRIKHLAASIIDTSAGATTSPVIVIGGSLVAVLRYR